MSVKHDHDCGHDDTDKSALQPTQKGLALCHKAILDSVAHWWSREGHPRHTSASTEEGRGWPEVNSAVRPTTNDNKTKISLESNVLSQPSAVRHLESYSPSYI